MRFLVDIVAIALVSVAVYAATKSIGLTILAQVLTAAYGLYCFYDGMKLSNELSRIP